MGKAKELCLAASLLIFITPIFAQETASGKRPEVVNTSSAGKAATEDPNYVIGAQDVLDVSVWKEPDLTRTVPVRPDGKISLPLLNDIQAAGLTPLQLAGEVTKSLNKFVTNPQVTIIVTQINSQRIYLLGEVARPGAYTMLPDMTVLQALSNAGGFGQYANPKKIYVLREENGKPQKFFFNYKDVIAGKHIEQNINLKPGDTIVVP
jgi:polysaccharide export outer membrane protein